MKFFITAVFFFSFSFRLYSQTFKELGDSLQYYFKNEEYEKGISVGEKQVIAAKKEFGEEHPAYVMSLNDLGLLYKMAGQYKKAETFYIQSMNIRKKIAGEENQGYAMSLNNLAALYATTARYEEAESLQLRAMAIRKKILGETHPDYAMSLNNLGALYKTLGKYEKAEPLYIAAININKKTFGENSPGYVNSLNNLAGLYKEMGKYKKAEPLYIEAINIRKKILGENHPGYASILGNLAGLYTDMSQYEKAESLYIQALNIQKNTSGEESVDYAASLNGLAILYGDMGKYEKAESLYTRSMAIKKEIVGEMHPEYASSLSSLAVLYQGMGKYEKAEPLYIQAIDIKKKTLGETHPAYATSINNLAMLYADMGQNEKAESLYIQALNIRKKALGEDHPDFSNTLNGLAVLYVEEGRYLKAESLYLQATDIRKKVLGEDHPKYATSLNNLAGLYEDMGKYEKAESLYIQAMNIREKILTKDHPDYASSLNNLAELYKKMGYYEKAELLLIEAMTIFKKQLGETHPDYAVTLMNLALFYESAGKFEKAESFAIQAETIEIKKLLNAFSFLSEQEKGNYLTQNAFLNDINSSFLYNHRNADPSFLKHNHNLLLLLKSLSLADTKNALEAVRNSKDSSIIKIFAQWQSNKIILSKQYSLPVVNRRTDLKALETATENAEKELNRRSSPFRNQQEAIRISMQDVQKQLRADEAAIEFVSFNLYNKKWTDSTIYCAYILKKNDSVPVFVPLCEEKQLQQLFDSAGNTATMVNSFYRGIKKNNKNLPDKDLYNLVWQPLEPYLKGINKISYSPAGKLYSIAFQALRVDSTTILMDKYYLQQYTSTRQVALRQVEVQMVKPGNITLFGNASFTMDSLQLIKQRDDQQKKEKESTFIYTVQKRNGDNGAWNNLPGTEEEVNTIKRLFDQNQITTRSYVQTEASEENLKALTGNSPQILHIATHGFFLPEPGKKRKEQIREEMNTYSLAKDPLLRSGLVLAGGNYAWTGKAPVEGIEDGIATAYEISQLNLSNTRLVVLSACETALGDVKSSEGVFGLQRAFKMAGVKKLIVSLWQVPDKETAELMTTFYSYWLNGKNVEESFYQAQTDMRKKYSPYYWAAFVLVE